MERKQFLDIAEYLDDEEMVQEYLNTVLEEGNAQEIIVALGRVAKAIGDENRRTNRTKSAKSI